MLHRVKENYHKPGDPIKPRKKPPTYQVTTKIPAQAAEDEQILQFLGPMN